MADKRSFELFARFVKERFPDARRVFDVAGGMGKLNEAMTHSVRDLEQQRPTETARTSRCCESH